MDQETTVTYVAAECAICKTTGGHVHPNCKGPRRTSGKRFGIEGLLCGRCYNSMRRRHIIGEDESKRRVPCICCGTEAGYVFPGCARPIRYHVVHDGVRGLACHECRYRHLERPIRSAAVQATTPAPVGRPETLARYTGPYPRPDYAAANPPPELDPRPPVVPTADEDLATLVREAKRRERARRNWGDCATAPKVAATAGKPPVKPANHTRPKFQQPEEQRR